MDNIRTLRPGLLLELLVDEKGVITLADTGDIVRAKPIGSPKIFGIYLPYAEKDIPSMQKEAIAEVLSIQNRDILYQSVNAYSTPNTAPCASGNVTIDFCAINADPEEYGLGPDEPGGDRIIQYFKPIQFWRISRASLRPILKMSDLI